MQGTGGMRGIIPDSRASSDLEAFIKRARYIPNDFLKDLNQSLINGRFEFDAAAINIDIVGANYNANKLF